MLDVVCHSEPAVKLEKDTNDKLVEMMIMFKKAMDSQDWVRAHVLILLVDSHTLTFLLSFTLDAIWFGTTQPELEGITRLINAIVSRGPKKLVATVLRTCLLASSLAACESTRMSYADTMNVLTQRLHGFLQKLNEDEVLKAEARATIEGFTCLSGYNFACLSHSIEITDRGNRRTITEIQLQLKAFQHLLDLAGDNLTGNYLSIAFIFSCFPLTLFSSLFDLDWSSVTSGIAIQGLLGMLVEKGVVADIVNRCCLVASHSGSTELVGILLQIAQMNNLDVDVDLALEFASQYGRIGTMEYLLPHIHPDILAGSGIEIIKAAGKRGFLEGATFLLRSDFLGDPSATYAVADSIATSEDESAAPELRTFLRKHWSEAAFAEGLSSGQDHYVNFMRIFKRGGSPICLRDLPAPLVTAIAYLPLYRECAEAGGRLLPQRLRGQLVEAVRRLGHGPVNNGSEGKVLLAVLERHLPPFFFTTQALGN